MNTVYEHTGKERNNPFTNFNSPKLYDDFEKIRSPLLKYTETLTLSGWSEICDPVMYENHRDDVVNISYPIVHAAILNNRLF